MKTMTTLSLLLAASLGAATLQAQTIAMDFNRTDCNGNQRHLFAELDSNHVAILEFFMLNCNSCITAGNKIKALKEDLELQYAGKIHSYSIAYHNSYTCTAVSDWVNTNGFGTVPMDSGATQVAYYGGFGMPTVVVVAGADHHVLFSTVGFSTSDTTTMGTVIRDFFATTTDLPALQANAPFAWQIAPNPVGDVAQVRMQSNTATEVAFQLINNQGQVLRQWANEPLATGESLRELDLTDVPAGVYFLRAQSAHFTDSQLLLRY